MKNHPQKQPFLYYKNAALTLLLFLSALVAGAQCGMTINTTINHVTCYNGTNGSLTISVTGGTAPYQYQLAEAGAGAWSSTTTYNGLAANTYPVSVRDNSGCIRTIYVTVNQPAPYVITHTATNVTCTGGNNGSISVNVSGGTSPYTYNWKRNNIAYATTANISGLTPANYKLVVTDGAGCTTSPVVSQVIKAIGLSGFNEDVVANGSNNAPTSVTTQAFDDGNGAVLYVDGYTNASGTAEAPGGLPSSRNFNSAQSSDRPYRLASYSSNNSLVLRSSTATSYGGSTSGTLTFQASDQGSYSTLYVLGSTGSGTGTVNYTVNFSDNTTATGQLMFADWYLASSTQSAIKLKRINRSTGVYDTRYDFNLFELPITISAANQSKTITSVGFSWVDAGSARVNIMGITGYTSTSLGITIADGTTGSVTPSVTVSSNAVANTFCTGQSVTFTANPVNGGNTPGYQWQRNGSNITGATSATYTTTTLSNNDVIRVIMTSNLTCVTTSNATSNGLTMINGTSVPAVSISSTGVSICNGSLVTFTAAPVNGGTNPSYQWKVNNINTGLNSPVFTSLLLNNNDNVKVVMTSNIACAVSNPATSNTIQMLVSLNVTPSISITSTPAVPGQGYPVTFSAVGTNGGTNPQYQWFKNGSIINGATAPTLTVPSPMYQDIYSVRLTSNHPCASTPYAMSNYTTIGPGILPVSLLWYNARPDNGKALLQWKTAQEINSKRFVIERAISTQPSSFSVIGHVNSMNNANGATYSYTDAPLVPGIYLYRLQEQDVSGYNRSLGIRAVDLSGKTTWQVQDAGSYWLLSAGQTFQYRLLDMQGRELKRAQGSGSVMIDKPNARSVYILQVDTGGQHFSKKLVN